MNKLGLTNLIYRVVLNCVLIEIHRKGFTEENAFDSAQQLQYRKFLF